MGFFDRLKCEYAYLTGALRALNRVTKIAKNTTTTWPDVAEGLAAKFGNRTALISAVDGRKLTYQQYVERAHQYSRWAQTQGLKKGDTVAILMGNQPEYLATWLGLGRMGVVCALLNTNLAEKALAHCIDIVDATHILIDPQLLPQMESAKTFLHGTPTIWVQGSEAGDYPAIEPLLDTLSTEPIPMDERPPLTTNDPYLYIYTSGTTGLPKAAHINHYRVQAIMNGFSAAANAQPDDRTYVCLPMYHTAGGLIATGMTLTVGGSVVIAPQFSVRDFWRHVVQHKCTLVEYIGELCRYLLNAPEDDYAKRHSVRLFVGNGLRPDIWPAFLARFGNPGVLEWYAATEGNAVLFNFDGKIGSIGRVPGWAKRRFPIEVVRYNMETEELARGADGRCIICAPDEPGEMMSQILNDPTKPSQRFDGYSDGDDTEKKIMRGVFATDDAWFRTGDLVRRDALGYFYFLDRIGDTFRWKGENVATSEVAETISQCAGVEHVNVYGVEVPDAEGRAGMAAISVNESFNSDELAKLLDHALPKYAHPVFLRIVDAMDLTGTFKVRKVDLVKVGYNPQKVGDQLMIRFAGSDLYEPLDAKSYDDLIAGRRRV